jgi:hypothetical protein
VVHAKIVNPKKIESLDVGVSVEVKAVAVILPS